MNIKKKAPLIVGVLALAILSACNPQSNEVAKVAPKQDVPMVQKAQSETVVANLVIDNKTPNGIAIVEGEHYRKLNVPVDLEGLADNSLLEIFWLGCPHCQNFETELRKWKKDGASKLPVVKMHAVSGNPRWIMDAHIYNSFEKLSGNNEAVMSGLFDLYINQYNVYRTAAQADSNTEEKPYPTIKLISEFALASGINEKDFSDAFQSEEVKAKVKSDGDLFIESEIEGVPAFIVNKQYVITGKDAKSYEDYFQIIEKVAELTKK